MSALRSGRDAFHFVIDPLLGDIDRTTRSEITMCGGVRGVDTTQLAALSTLIRVVD
jgi:hypothetical protein